MADAEPAVDAAYAGLKAFWDKLNKNADGVIDGKEWGSVVGSRLEEFKSWFPGETARDIGTYFNKADMNDDDKITWSEFVAASELAGLKKLFLSLDVNADGNVSSKEYGQMLTAKFDELKAVFGGKTKAEVGKKFNLLNTAHDEDADGKQYISWAEFQQGWFNTQVVPEFVDLKKLWDTLDKNTDGLISSKEWGNAVTANADLMMKLFGGSSLSIL